MDRLCSERDATVARGHGEAHEAAIDQPRADDGDGVVDGENDQPFERAHQKIGDGEMGRAARAKTRDIWRAGRAAPERCLTQQQGDQHIGARAGKRQNRPQSPEATAHLLALGRLDAHRRPDGGRDKEQRPHDQDNGKEPEGPEGNGYQPEQLRGNEDQRTLDNSPAHRRLAKHPEPLPLGSLPYRRIIAREGGPRSTA